MELKDYLKVIRRRWPWFVGVLFLFASIFGGFYVRERPQYLAVAKLLIRIETADAYLNDPTIRPQMPGLSTATREALLSSDPVLQHAAYIYGAQLALDLGLVDVADDSVKAAFKASDVPADRRVVTKSDLAAGILALAKEIPVPASLGTGTFGDLLDTQSAPFRVVSDRIATVRVSRVSDKVQFVNVTCTSFDPADAVRLVNAVAYAGEDWSDRDTKRTVETALKRKTDEQEELVKRRKALSLTAAEISSLEASRSFAQTALSQARMRRDTLVSERHRVERVQAKEREEDHKSGTPFGRSRAITDDVRQIASQLRDVDLRLEHLLEVHTPEARDVKQLERQKKVLVAQLAAARSNAAEERRLALEAELSYYDEEIAEVDKRIAETTAEIAAVTEKLDGLIPAREELARIDTQLGRVTEVQARLKTLLDVLHGFIQVQKPADGGVPQPKSMEKSWAFWLLMAVLVGLGVCYFREYLDTSILTEYDVRRHLNLPVLGMIPELAQVKETRGMVSEDLSRSPLSETFNTIGTLVRTALDQEGWKSILVASANPSEGKTFVSIQLAMSLARKGLRVLLVDSDMRMPQIHVSLGLEKDFGLSSILEGRMEGREQVGEATGEAARGSTLDAYVQKTNIPNLSVITSGPAPQSPVQLLESQRMRDLMVELRERADFIIFDTPPICSVGDCITLATIVDVVLYVVGAGYSEQQDATWAKHLLNNVHANILGVVMNRMETTHGREYYYYYTRDRKNVRTGT